MRREIRRFLSGIFRLKKQHAISFLCVFGAFILPGCSPPPVPPEVGLAERMNHDLWKARADVYAPEEYRSYETAFKAATDDLIREGARFVWFRDYEPVAARLKVLLNDGEAIFQKVQECKEARRVETTRQLSAIENRIADLDRLSFTINEGRLARTSLTKASLLVKEASLSLGREDYEGAASRLTMASEYIKTSEDRLSAILGRYADKKLIEKWRRWITAVIAESGEKGIPAIVVTKLDRRLTLYKGGKSFKTYDIGIGRNGLSDKRLAGDGATPEGSYKVIKKRTISRYHRALLLNYPNDDDRHEFLRLKKSGLIPKGGGMGGSIEIHGGGKDGMTYGCVSLENRDMDEVFESVPLGTPVAIVGTVLQTSDPPFIPQKVGDE
jgi:L,D-peptidoglycan transpeptidase YkuD (ErfK/YbiS/YcfS/YnhG family)